ncbi:unnamed protein product [Blepharisma stoltei]|uniref:Protein kinase domain-containing protein n=1 Tax=Blepharisma stoltei TaxID=1481888 RepID=A0AAU9KDE2_9CILI|nr:unnamed protein product [Blepharisma stoltei]
MIRGYFPISDHISNANPSYIFESLIGEGSFGCVYKAYDPTNNLSVAIKRSLKSGCMVSREFSILKETVNCPNCVKLLDIFYSVTDDNKFIQHLVFECMPKNLAQFLAERWSLDPLNDFEITSIMRQLLKGLEYLHSKNIMHRDIKPQNILIDDNDEFYKVKLCDFGSAKFVTGKNMPYVVSRYYRAPELILLNTDYGTEIDIWAAGCVFIELFTGCPIFRGDTEADQFIKIANIIGPPTATDMKNLTKSVQLNTKMIQRIIKIGRKIQWVHLFKRSPKAEEAFDLAQKMVCWDPTKRFTATQCLEHPFFLI